MSDVFFLASERVLDFFSSPNKINLFCHTGVRLLAVEAEVRLRCAAALECLSLEAEGPPRGQCLPDVLFRLLVLCGNDTCRGWCLLNGEHAESKKPIVVFFWCY